MVEVHREYGDDQDSMFLKLLLARWANTVIAAFIAYGRRSRLSATALSGVMSILLMDAFLLPVLRVFDVYDLFMRYVVGPRQPSQQDERALVGRGLEHRRAVYRYYEDVGGGAVLRRGGAVRVAGDGGGTTHVLLRGPLLSAAVV